MNAYPPHRHSHQTIRIARGRHRHPRQGASVMELSSMLAGERFSDRPACACSVVAAFLRTYGDAIGFARRQDLYRYAAMVVGTAAAPDGVRARRAALCRQWAAAGSSRCRWRPWLRRRLRRAKRLPVPPGHEDLAVMAARVAAVLQRGCDPAPHAAALAFVDQLLAVGVTQRGVDPALSLSPADQDWLSVH